MGFEQGLSGLNAAAKNLEIIGNNVSNANTVGFKTASAQFSDVFARSFSDRSSSSIGRGTSLESVQQNFAQGSITPTNNPLDMAINGKGFFKTKTVQGETLYTRNGQFSIDGDGFIQNAAGSKLLGFSYDLTTGQVSGVETPIQFPQQAIAPQVTDEVVMRFNLDSRENVIPASVGLDITDLTTFNSTLAATVYDQLGVDHSLSVYFQKLDPTTNVAGGGNSIKFTGEPIKLSYELPETVVAAEIDIRDADGTLVRTLTATTDKGFQSVSWDGNKADGTAALDGVYTFDVRATKADGVADADTDPDVVAATTFSAVTFEDEVPGATSYYRVFAFLDGKPITDNDANPTNPLSSTKIIGFGEDGKTPSYPEGVIPVPYQPKFTLDLKNFDSAGDGVLFGSQVSLDFDGSTQYGSSFGVNNVKQNGYESAALSSFSVSSEGILKGRYTNGQTQDLAQIALVTFRNPDGLRPAGANNFIKTATAGTEYLARDDETASSSIVAGALESANLDLTNELVNIITAQRIYQANAQTVKAQDSILQTLVNLR
jgi:flagellar hook protein FlgE